MSGRLAQVLDARMSQRVQRPDSSSLGTIQGDGSLLVDGFRVPLPAGQYLVCRGIDPALVAGDRVLVVWVNNGVEPVVVNVVS
jgi:hypothetical protein